MKITFITFERLNSNPIYELELSDRSSNCLKRAGAQTIGDVISLIETDKLGAIRGCGVKVQREVKNALFNYELCNATDVIRFLQKVEVEK